MVTKKFRIFSLVFGLFLAQAVYGADFQVNQLGDAGDGTCDATCTLRDAITAANSAATDDSVSFSYILFNSPQTIVVTGADIQINNNGSLIIFGNGADRITIDGNGNGRIFTVNAGANATIKGLRLTNGNGVSSVSTGRGGAVYNNGGNLTLENIYIVQNTAANGGGLNTANSGTTTIIDCELANNTALTSSGGGLQNFSTSTLNVYGTTFRGNTSNSGTGGGGIQGGGDITITNSTFSGNTATGGDGGGISYNGGSTRSLIVTNSTFSGNTAGDQGGGIRKNDTTNNGFIRNNIVTGNTSNDNSDLSGLYASQGFNVVQTAAAATGLTMNDITGSSALLTPIGNYGGFSFTHALLSGSPAIDAGDNCVIDLSCATRNPPAAVSTDQRGAMRPFGAAVDIGSFENSASYIAKLDDGTVGVPYSEIITPNRMGFTYTLVGSLPPGLTFNTPNFNKGEGSAPTANISGTPTANGTYNFQIMISNGTNSTTVNYQIRITPTNLTGRLLDEGGNPVSGVFVTINDGMGGVQTTQTSIDGTYIFNNITAGTTYTVSFNNRRYAFRSEQITIVAGTNALNPIITN